jgi:putative transposase
MKHCWHLVADRAVRSHLVVVSTPSLAFSACLVEAEEPIGVQALSPKLAVQAFDECVVGRLAGPAEVKSDAATAKVEFSSSERSSFPGAAPSSSDPFVDLRSRFTEEQIIAVLREQKAGVPTAEICRKHGVSSATFYKWKAKFGGLDVSEARRLKTLERENNRLKRMLAEAMLDNAALKDLLGKKW